MTDQDGAVIKEKSCMSGKDGAIETGKIRDTLFSIRFDEAIRSQTFPMYFQKSVNIANREILTDFSDRRY